VIHRIEQRAPRWRWFPSRVQYLTGQSLEWAHDGARAAPGGVGLDLAHGSATRCWTCTSGTSISPCGAVTVISMPGRRDRRMFRARASCAQRRFAAVRRLVGHDPVMRFQMGPEFIRSPARGLADQQSARAFRGARYSLMEIFQRAGIGRLREKIHGLDRILAAFIELCCRDWWTSSRRARRRSVAANSAYDRAIARRRQALP